MTNCSNCGTENDETLSACRGCGTLLPTSEGTLPATGVVIAEPNDATAPSAQIELSNAPPERGRELKAWPATLVLVVYLASQVVGSITAMVIGMAVTAAQGQNLQNPQQVRRTVAELMPGVVLGTLVAGGIGMFVIARVLVPQSLRDRSATGAAWVRGPWLDMAKGLPLGLLIGFAGSVFMTYLERVTGGPTSLGPVTKMAASSKTGFAIWTISALLLAPVVEEPLFRGLLYGGFRRSAGAAAAGIITTAIFILLHSTEIIHFLPAILPLAVLAVCALWVRLHFAAIGPAIALHFGYNAVLALAFYRQMR